jgi:hypothetical protein
VNEPAYLYSGQKRHIADPDCSDDDSDPRRRLALCGARHDTEFAMVARFRRQLSGDLTFGRRIDRARRFPVCSWCSNRWAER